MQLLHIYQSGESAVYDQPGAVKSIGVISADGRPFSGWDFQSYLVVEFVVYRGTEIVEE